MNSFASATEIEIENKNFEEAVVSRPGEMSAADMAFELNEIKEALFKTKDEYKDTDGNFGLRFDDQYYGEIMDVNTKKVMCESYGRVASAIQDHIPVVNNKIKIRDESDTEIELDLAQCKIYSGLEGTIIRIWNDGEKTRFSTHKKINASKSRWIVTKSFYEMYLELDGPIELFEQQPVKECTFFFLIVHPSVQVVSSVDVGAGRLIYLGFAGNPEGKIHNNFLQKKFPNTPISLKEANQILKVATDHRMCEANFVILSQYDIKVKVMSPAYVWRSKIRNEDPNIMHLWYSLLTDSYIQGKGNSLLSDLEFKKKYPILKQEKIQTIKSMIESGKVKFEKHPDQNIPLDRNTRLFNVFQVLLTVVSPSCRMELFTVYREYYKQISNLSQWLFSLCKYGVNLDEFEKKDSVGPRQEKRTNRVKQIVSEVKKFADVRMDGGMYNPRLNKNGVILENIHGLLSKEFGNSLYRLVKTMEEHVNKATEEK